MEDWTHRDIHHVRYVTTLLLTFVCNFVLLVLLMYALVLHLQLPAPLPLRPSVYVGPVRGGAEQLVRLRLKRQKFL